jgi:hypothetical protein
MADQVYLITEGAHPPNVFLYPYSVVPQYRYPIIANRLSHMLYDEILKISPDKIFREGITQVTHDQIWAAPREMREFYMIQDYSAIFAYDMEFIRDPFKCEVVDLDKGFEPYEKQDELRKQHRNWEEILQTGRENYWVHRRILPNLHDSEVALLIVGEGHRTKNEFSSPDAGNLVSLLNQNNIEVEHVYTSPDLSWVNHQALHMQ